MDRTGSPVKSGHVPLFDSPSKYGVHHTIASFTPTERRFQWQNSTSSTDALYKLPTCIGTGPKKGFGTSTREDWDILTKKNTNACSGPGSYESIGSCGKQPSAVLRTAATTAFENAPRTPLQSDSTPSPGPVYDLPLAIGTAPSTKFGLAKRQPLAPANIGPGPNITLRGSFKECRAPTVSPTFGTERRLRASPSSSASAPGPIYELEPTGFRTGSSTSFSHAKRF